MDPNELNDKVCDVRESGDVSKHNHHIARQSSTDSIASITFPWRWNMRNPVVMVSRQETGRQTEPQSFFICLMSVLILCTGIFIIGISCWEFLYRMPYIYLTDGHFFMTSNSFSLSSGLLSLPCFWLLLISHNNVANHVLLPLLMIVLGFSIIMVSTGGTVGAIYRSKMVFNYTEDPPKLASTLYAKVLNETLLTTLNSYKVTSGYQNAWDVIQRRLECCGVNEPDDWLQNEGSIPISCFRNGNMSSNYYEYGCLYLVAEDLAFGTCLLIGTCLIVFTVQMVTLLFVVYVNIKGKFNRL